MRPKVQPDLTAILNRLTALETTTGTLETVFNQTTTAAQSAQTAEAARQNAVAARGQAEQIVNNISGVLGSLSEDGLLNQTEKRVLINKVDELDDQYVQYGLRAVALGITTELTAVNTAWNAWITYLGTLNPAWNNTTQTTTINRATFNQKLTDYTSSLVVLAKKVSEEDAKRASWPTVTGTGRPADYADVTGANISAGFTGQGSLATLNSVGYGSGYLTGFGTLAGRSTARFNNEVFRSNGSTIVTDNDAITALGISAGFTGQGAMASLNSFPWTASYITSKPYFLTDVNSVDANPQNVRMKATYLRDDAGVRSMEAYFPQDMLANRTEARISAGFTGQGGLATLNNVAWASHITGRPVPLTDLANVAGTDRFKSDYVWSPTYSSTIEGRWPAELGANVTESRTAAAIFSQGVLATRNNARVGWELVDEGGGYLAPAYIKNNNNTAAGSGFVQRPVGGEYSWNATNVPGAIQIKLPNVIGDQRYCMIKFQVDIFDYNVGTTVTYDVAGYMYAYPAGPGWINCTAKAIGGSPGAVKAVRFGRTGNGASDRFCVWIGEVAPATQWQYPQVQVRNVVTGYSGYDIAYWQSGWELTNVTAAFPAVDVTVANPTPGDAVFGLNAYETWGGGIATLPNFKTGLGVAAGFTGQGGLATLNNVGWSTHITGRPLPLTDLTNIAGTDRFKSDYVWSPAYSSTIEGRWPAELGANVTESRTAAAFTGQSPWATYTTTSPSGFESRTQNLSALGFFSALNAISDRRLTLLRRADGVTDVTEASVITALGTAASIIGQGTGATANTLAQLDPTAAAALAAAAGGGQTTVPIGTSRTILVGIGVSLNYEVALFVNAGGTGGDVTVRVEWSPSGANTWTTIATIVGDFAGPTEPGSASGTGSWTNSTGIRQNIDFRAVRVNPTVGGTIKSSQSYLLI